MKQLPIPQFDELVEVLNQTPLKMHPSQVHGIVTGLLCANPKNHAPWEEMVTGKKETPEAQEMLKRLYDGSANQLAQFSFEFEMVLPDDECDLTERAEAMTLWCQGFLTGLKSGGVQVVDREESEVTEAIDDIVEIAKMNYEQVVASEEDEQAYAELMEYVRLSAVMIYQQLREETTKATSPTGQLH